MGSHQQQRAKEKACWAPHHRFLVWTITLLTLKVKGGGRAVVGNWTKPPPLSNGDHRKLKFESTYLKESNSACPKGPSASSVVLAWAPWAKLGWGPRDQRGPHIQCGEEQMPELLPWHLQALCTGTDIARDQAQQMPGCLWPISSQRSTQLAMIHSDFCLAEWAADWKYGSDRACLKTSKAFKLSRWLITACTAC